MAFSIYTDWEFRPTGASDNGGGYVRNAGTTDYSQQDAAEATFTNLATDVAGTQVTDSDGGGNMTAQMVGNTFQIAGAWYEIKTYIDTNNVTIDRSAGSSQSGLSGKIGGAISVFTDALTENFEEGNNIYVKNGTYTLTGNIACSKDGNAADGDIIWQGYNSTRGDNPVTAATMPHISCGAYYFQPDFYNRVKNIRFSGTGIQVLNIRNRSQAVKCIASNTSGTANRYAIWRFTPRWCRRSGIYCTHQRPGYN
jgi:hypothetical protein